MRKDTQKTLSVRQDLRRGLESEMLIDFFIFDRSVSKPSDMRDVASAAQRRRTGPYPSVAARCASRCTASGTSSVRAKSSQSWASSGTRQLCPNMSVELQRLSMVREEIRTAAPTGRGLVAQPLMVT